MLPLGPKKGKNGETRNEPKEIQAWVDSIGNQYFTVQVLSLSNNFCNTTKSFSLSKQNISAPVPHSCHQTPLSLLLFSHSGNMDPWEVRSWITENLQHLLCEPDPRASTVKDNSLISQSYMVKQNNYQLIHRQATSTNITREEECTFSRNGIISYHVDLKNKIYTNNLICRITEAPNHSWEQSKFRVTNIEYEVEHTKSWPIHFSYWVVKIMV